MAVSAIQMSPTLPLRTDETIRQAEQAVDLSIVMPVFNEEQALPGVLKESAASLAEAPFTFEIVFVDDASRDASLSLLTAFRDQNPDLSVRVLRHEINRGIAASCNTLFDAARGRYVFLNASDGQCQTAECVEMMKLRGRYDIVVGKRHTKHYTTGRTLISCAFNLLPWILFGVRTVDAGSIKLFHAEMLRIPLLSRGPFREAERLIRAQRLGYRIGVVPVANQVRQGGKPTGARLRLVIQSIWDLIHCWWDVVVCRRILPVPQRPGL